MLRHDARTHPRNRGSRQRPAAASAGTDRKVYAAQRARAADRAAGLDRIEFHHGRRAHQHHRLSQVRAAHQSRRPRRSPGNREAADRRRREHPRRQHGRRPSRLREGHDRVPQPHRFGAGNRPRADHDRLIEMVGPRGGAEVHAGEIGGQFDLPEGRGREIPPTGTAGPTLRRGRGGDGLRRKGASGHHRAKSSDLLARPRHPGQRSGIPADRHHLRS